MSSDRSSELVGEDAAVAPTPARRCWHNFDCPGTGPDCCPAETPDGAALRGWNEYHAIADPRAKALTAENEVLRAHLTEMTKLSKRLLRQAAGLVIDPMACLDVDAVNAAEAFLRAPRTGRPS